MTITGHEIYIKRIAALEQELAEAQEHDKINIDFIRQYQDEAYQLRQAVKQFVEEMDAQFPKLEMLPGEYDTLTKLVRRE